jgi:hypothetical protein
MQERTKQGPGKVENQEEDHSDRRGGAQKRDRQNKEIKPYALLPDEQLLILSSKTDIRTQHATYRQVGS